MKVKNDSKVLSLSNMKEGDVMSLLPMRAKLSEKALYILLGWSMFGGGDQSLLFDT